MSAPDLPGFGPDRAGIDLDRAASRHVEQRIGLIALAGLLVVLLAAALWIPLDSGAYAEGFVIVSGERQAVQHPLGGVVKVLHVKEGDKVTKGEVLVELDDRQAEAEARAAAAQVVGLEATRARLVAVRDGAASVTTPDLFFTLTGPEKTLADDAISGERRVFDRDNAAYHAQHQVLGQKSAELKRQVESAEVQSKSAADQRRIVDAELGDVNRLFTQGYVPAPRVQELERTGSQLDGAKGSSDADASRAREAIGETALQAVSLDQGRRSDAANKLSDVEDKLATVKPQWQAAEKKLEDTKVKAPVAGTVVDLTSNTEGGVVSAGQVLMQIVPSEKSLIIEAHVKPDDITDLRPGQTAEIKFPAFKDRTTPILTGTVQTLSADRITDPKTGVAYFKMLVAATPETIALLHRSHGENGELKAGLQAQVVVRLHARSAFGYLTEPLGNAVWKSFREK